METSILSLLRKKRIVRVLSLVMVHVFFLCNAGFASIGTSAATPKGLEVAEEVTVDSIGVAKDLGTVKARYTGRGNKIILHIQDAHCNYEAQTNISRMLENFSRNYNINIISVEGADGYVDTSWFKAFPDAEIRKEVADYFMKKGEITGAEFLSITKDYPIKLYGAEDRDLYIQNLNAFTTTYPIKGQIEKYLVNIKTILGRLKGYIYTRGLKNFDSKVEEYKEKKMSLSDYAKFLSVSLKRHNLNLRKYPDFSKLVYTLVYEDKIDFKVVNEERTELIDRLSKAFSKERLQELVGMSVSFKTGKVSAAEYYQYLKDISDKEGISLPQEYTNLANYVIYTRLYEKIDNENLFDELDRIKNAIKEKLFSSDDQRNLSICWDNVSILLGLINIKLSNKEFNYYKANARTFKPEFFVGFIRSKINMYNLSYNIEDPSDLITENIPKLEEFYRIAVKRDMALINNTLETMDKEDVDIAVLISGGFHTEGIRRILEEKQLSYVVVCPNITKDVESPYIKVLTNQRTPFEELLVESATPTKGDSLLAPYLVSQLILKERKMTEVRDELFNDRIEDMFTDRGIEIRQSWIRNYGTRWIHKGIPILDSLNMPRSTEVLLDSFIVAFDERAKEHLGREDRDTLIGEIREEFKKAIEDYKVLHPEVVLDVSVPAQDPADGTGSAESGEDDTPDGVAISFGNDLVLGKDKYGINLHSLVNSVTQKLLQNRTHSTEVIMADDPHFITNSKLRGKLTGEEKKIRVCAIEGWIDEVKIRYRDKLHAKGVKEYDAEKRVARLATKLIAHPSISRKRGGVWSIYTDKLYYDIWKESRQPNKLLYTLVKHEYAHIKSAQDRTGLEEKDIVVLKDCDPKELHHALRSRMYYVVTGGGDAAGLNTTIAKLYGELNEEKRILIGIPNAFLGLYHADIGGIARHIDGELADTIAQRSSTDLGSSRKEPFDDPRKVLQIIKNMTDYDGSKDTRLLELLASITGEENRDKILTLGESDEEIRETLKTLRAIKKIIIKNGGKNTIGGMFVTGGDDHMTVAAKLSRLFGDLMPINAIPKSIDNDVEGLMVGHRTAVRTGRVAFWESAVYEGINVCEVMGRKAGHLALGIGRRTLDPKDLDSLPRHVRIKYADLKDTVLILTPEETVSIEDVVRRAHEIYEAKGAVNIVVAEGFQFWKDKSKLTRAETRTGKTGTPEDDPLYAQLLEQSSLIRARAGEKPEYDTHKNLRLGGISDYIKEALSADFGLNEKDVDRRLQPFDRDLVLDKDLGYIMRGPAVPEWLPPPVVPREPGDWKDFPTTEHRTRPLKNSEYRLAGKYARQAVKVALRDEDNTGRFMFIPDFSEARTSAQDRDIVEVLFETETLSQKKFFDPPLKVKINKKAGPLKGKMRKTQKTIKDITPPGYKTNEGYLRKSGVLFKDPDNGFKAYDIPEGKVEPKVIRLSRDPRRHRELVIEKMRLAIYNVARTSMKHSTDNTNSIFVVDDPTGEITFEAARSNPNDLYKLMRGDNGTDNDLVNKLETSRDALMILTPQEPLTIKDILDQVDEIRNKRGQPIVYIVVASGFKLSSKDPLLCELIQEHPRMKAVIDHVEDDQGITVASDREGKAMTDNIGSVIQFALLHYMPELFPDFLFKYVRLTDFSKHYKRSGLDLEFLGEGHSDLFDTRFSDGNLYQNGVVLPFKRMEASKATVGSSATGEVKDLETARAYDAIYRKSIEDNGLKRERTKIVRGRTKFSFVLHDTLVEDVYEHNKQNPDLQLDYDVRPGRGGYVKAGLHYVHDGWKKGYRSRGLYQAHIDTYVYNNLTEEERNILARHETAHIDIFNVEERKEDRQTAKQIKKALGWKAYDTWLRWDKFLKRENLTLVSPEVSREEMQEIFINSQPGSNTTEIYQRIQDLSKEKPFFAKLKNLEELRETVINGNQGTRTIEAIVNRGDGEIIEKDLIENVDIFRADAKTDGTVRVTVNEETTPHKKGKDRRGQWMGLLDAERKTLAKGVRPLRDDVPISIMMPGKGTRSTLLTERNHGIKPRMKMLIRKDKDSPWLSAAEASLYLWNHLAFHLKRLGFKGKAFKWGDEPQLASTVLSQLDEDTMDLSDVDIVRFGSEVDIGKLRRDDPAKLTYLTENKEWLTMDDEGNLTGWARRRPLDQLLPALGIEDTKDGSVKAMTHIGSPAFSHVILQEAKKVFKGVDPNIWIDVDGFLIEALTMTREQWDDERKLYAPGKGIHEVEAQCENYYDLVQELRERVNIRMKRPKKARLKIKVIDFGAKEDMYWGDIGNLIVARDAIHQVADHTSEGAFARELAHINDIKPDEFGNIIVGESTVYPKDGSVRNSVLIDTQIYGRSNIDGAVIVNSRLGRASIGKGSVIWESTVKTLTMGEKAFSYHSVKENLKIKPFWVHTSIPKNMRNLAEGFEDWWASTDIDPTTKTKENPEGKPYDVGAKPYYAEEKFHPKKNNPFGNPGSFQALHERVRKRFKRTPTQAMEAKIKKAADVIAKKAAALKPKREPKARVSEAPFQRETSPGIYAASATPAVRRFLRAKQYGDLPIDVITAIVKGDIEEALRIYTDVIPQARKSESLEDSLANISNELIAYYGKLRSFERDVVDPKIIQFYTGVVKWGGIASIQRIVANTVIILSAITRGDPGADKIKIESDPELMIVSPHEDKGEGSYLSKESFEHAGIPLATTEGERGLYGRGSEGEEKLGENLLRNMAYAENMVDLESMIMYAMIHGITKVPEALESMTDQGVVSTMHDTAFVNGLLPKSIQRTSTGRGHWQGFKLDVKQVTKGKVLQLIDIYDHEGFRIKTLANVVREGEYTQAIPGSVDYMIPLTDIVEFNDISIDLEKLYSEDPQLNDAALAKTLTELNPYFFDNQEIDVEQVFREIEREMSDRIGESENKIANYQAIDIGGETVLVPLSKTSESGPLKKEGPVPVELVDYNAAMTAAIAGSVGLRDLGQEYGLVKYYRGIQDSDEIGNLVGALAAAVGNRKHLEYAEEVRVIDSKEDVDEKYIAAIGKLSEKVENGEPLNFVRTYTRKGEAEPVMKEVWDANEEAYAYQYIGSEPMDLTGSGTLLTSLQEGYAKGEVTVETRIDMGTQFGTLSTDILSTLWPDKTFGYDHLAQFGALGEVSLETVPQELPSSLKISDSETLVIPRSDGYMYIGVSVALTREAFIEALRKGHTSILNQVKVKKNVPYIIPAGLPYAYGDKNTYVEVKAGNAKTTELFDRLWWMTDTFQTAEKSDKAQSLLEGILVFDDQIAQEQVQAEPRQDIIDSFRAGRQAVIEGLLETGLLRDGKDLLTLSDVAQDELAKQAEKNGYLKPVDIESLKVGPVLASDPKVTARSRFDIMGVAGLGFAAGQYTIQENEALDTHEILEGKRHVLQVLEGGVELIAGDETTILKKGDKRTIPASTGIYRLRALAGHGEAVVFAAAKPLPRGVQGDIAEGSTRINDRSRTNLPVAIPETSPAAEMKLLSRRDGHMTEQGTHFHRVQISGKGVRMKVPEGQNTVTFELEAGEETRVVQNRTIVAKLKRGEPVILPISGDYTLSGAGTVRVTYPESDEEKPVYSTVSAVQSYIDNGKIQKKLADTDKIGVQFIMTKSTAEAVYRKRGKSRDPMHIRHEARFLEIESILTQAGVKVEITTVENDWSDLENAANPEYLSVTWVTDKEVYAVQMGPEKVLKTLAKYPRVPIDSRIIEELQKNEDVKTKGKGWFYTRELEGLSVMLAVTEPEELDEKTTSAERLLAVINTMISSPLRDVRALKALLPVAAGTALDVIQNIFGKMIQRILITLPARPFSPQDELHRRRQVLWSV